MDKIIQFKNSFERLLKVWVSKLDFNEQDLVAEDLIWIDEIFNDFFSDNNINDFINRDGRYQEVLKLPDFDFSDFLSSTVEYSNNKPERWARLKVEEPNYLEFYKQLNEFNSNNYKNNNVIDIYFRLLKKLYYIAVDKDLINTKSIVLSRILSAVQKVSVFEKDGFNSKSLLNDLYYVVINKLFTSKEIREEKPDEEFISMALFKSTFLVYYLPYFKFHKVPIAKQYLLNTWVYLETLDKNYLLDEFMNSLAGMTLSSSSFREIDIFDIRSLLNKEDHDSEFFILLNKIVSSSNLVVLQKDLQDLFQLTDDIKEINWPSSIERNIVEFFLYDEKSRAIELYKFREMQSLVLEFLGLVLHFKDKDYFLESIMKLRKNEQWSNHLNFFPQSVRDLLVWLVLLKNLKFQMSGRFEPAFGYRFLNEIILFFFKDLDFDEVVFRQSLEERGVSIDSSFLSSLKNLSEEILEGIKDNVFFEDFDNERLIAFWDSLVNWIGNQIGKSEVLTPIPIEIFENLEGGIFRQYKNRSLLYFLSKKLSKFNRSGEIQIEFGTRVVASDLQFRKYLIPDWYVPAYGLIDAFGSFLVEEESMQFDFNFLQKQVALQTIELKRDDINPLFEKHGRNSLFVFRNAYPDFWLKTTKPDGTNFGSKKTIFLNETVFSYKTFDGNSELIIIPQTSLALNFVIDGRLRNLRFLEDTLMSEIIDLSDESNDKVKYLRSIKGFSARFDLSDKELKKRFWIRIIAKTKILVKDKDSILRFKLNPYGV